MALLIIVCELKGVTVSLPRAPLTEWPKQRRQIVLVISKVPTNSWVELQNEADLSGFLIIDEDRHLIGQLEKLLGTPESTQG